MSGALLFGAGYAFASAVQPGPLQAFLVAKVAQKGVRATLPAAFAPLISDVPIAVVALLLLKSLPLKASALLQISGGVLLVGLAFSAYRQAGRPVEDTPDRHAAPRTLVQAIAVNLLNPNPYLGWSLVLGPRVLDAWRHGPGQSIALIAGFYGTMVGMLALTIVFFGSARWLGPRGRSKLILVSAILLAVLGLIQLITGMGSIATNRFPGI